jgi:hypothetical protein
MGRCLEVSSRKVWLNNLGWTIYFIPYKACARIHYFSRIIIFLWYV